MFGSMRYSNSFCLLLSNYVIVYAIHTNCYRHISVKGVHSLHQWKRNKPVKIFSRKSRKGVKVAEKEKVDSKIYTRDTVRNIYNILRNSTWSAAQEQLERISIRWDSYLINQVLKTHPPMEKAWLFFNWASRLRMFKHDQFTYTTMLDIFGEAGRISSMKYVFEQMKEKGIKIDVVTYTSLMHWLSNSGDIDGAILVWKEMKAKHCYPTVVSYTAYMKILFDNGQVKEAANAYKEMLQSGISPNCCTYTILMEYLIGAGKGKEALDIFHKMQDAGVYPDKAACNILIQKCCKSGEMLVMTRILEYMKENRLVLRYPVFVEAHETFKINFESDTLLRQVNPHIQTESVNKDVVRHVTTSANFITSNVDCELVKILLRKDKFFAVDHVLMGMMDKNIQLDSATISNIIEVNSKCNRPNGALLAYDYGLKKGLNMERNLYLDLLGTLIRSSAYPKLLEIVQEMYRQGHCLGLYHATLIIYRLGKARRPQCAVKIFNLLPDELKCTATYTALIGAFFSAGSSGKGLRVYKSMRHKGFSPSLGTYNVLLTGLSKSGRVIELEMYRREKKSFEISGWSHNTMLEEERICDLLFGELVP